MAVTTLGSRAVMSTVKLRENGALVEFYVAKHNYESGLNGAGRTLLVRKTCHSNQKWHTSNVNAYASSALDAWFNGTYKAMLDADVQAAMGSTKFYYTIGNGNKNKSTLQRAVFALSGSELGISGDREATMNAEGTVLPGASTLKGIAQQTRSPVANCTNESWGITKAGAYHYICAGYTLGARPALTLPSTWSVSDDGRVLVGVPPTITGSTVSGSDLGEKAQAFEAVYTVTDDDGDPVTVKEYLDDVLQRSYTAVLGESNTFRFSNWQCVLNGSHTLKVVANDGKMDSNPYTLRFTKSVTQASVTLAQPLEADDQITVMVLSVLGSIPVDAAYSVLVTNNAKDDAPVWEDATGDVKAGVNHLFTNQTAAEGFAFNFRVEVARGESGQGGYLSGIGGAFE